MTMHFLQPAGESRRTSANVIVIEDDDGLFMFDVGSGLERDVGSLLGQMRSEKLDVRRLHTVVLSHVHPDHVGGIHHLCRMADRTGLRVLVHERERDIAGHAELLHESLDFGLIGKHLDRSAAARAGLGNIRTALERMLPGTPFPEGVEIRTLRGGEIVSLGGHEFLVIATPGHSPGHLCFYEVHERTLLVGDLLGDASAMWYAPSCGGVSEFTRSLERIGALDALHVLPSHGDRSSDFEQRLDRAREFVARRDALILRAIDDGPRTVWDLAGRMFEARMQRVFPGIMLVETHLERLQEQGRIAREGKWVLRARSPGRVLG